MTTPDAKLEQHRDTEGPARRTYASLEGARGFGVTATSPTAATLISIQPMDVRTYWRHVGSGKWNSKDALYEEVKP